MERPIFIVGTREEEETQLLIKRFDSLIQTACKAGRAKKSVTDNICR